MTSTIAPADFRDAAEAAWDDCNADTLRVLIAQAQRLLTEECCDKCGGIDGEQYPDICGIVCPECMAEMNKAFQEAHEDGINEAADHKRRMREES